MVSHARGEMVVECVLGGKESRSESWPSSSRRSTRTTTDEADGATEKTWTGCCSDYEAQCTQQTAEKESSA